MKTGNAKRVIGLLAAMAMGVAMPGLVMADLPGLPPKQAPAGVPDGETRSTPMPVFAPPRGSLFKQGVVAAASVPAIPGVDSPKPNISYIAVQAPQARRYQKNDVVTVIVREDSDSTTNGQGGAKKTQDFDFAIQQFLQLALSNSGLPTVGTVNSPSSLPEIKFKYSNDTKSDASQQRRDSFSARVSGTVVDVKPNGTLVVEAVKQIVVDKEEQTFKLTGVCRVEDLGPDNTVLSTQLANLTLSKQTKGMVHDGNKRGWLNQLIDRVTPF